MKTNYLKLLVISAFFTFAVTDLQSQDKAVAGRTWLEMEGNQKPMLYMTTDLTKPLTYKDNGITYVACIFNGAVSGIDAYLDKYKMNAMKSRKPSGEFVSQKGKGGRGVFNAAATKLKVIFRPVYWSEKGTILRDHPVIWVDTHGEPIKSGRIEKDLDVESWATSYFEGPVMINIKPTECNKIKAVSVGIAAVGIGAALTFAPGAVLAKATAASMAVTTATFVVGSVSGFGISAIADRCFKDNSAIYYGFLSPDPSKDCTAFTGDCVISPDFKVFRTGKKCDGVPSSSNAWDALIKLPPPKATPPTVTPPGYKDGKVTPPTVTPPKVQPPKVKPPVKVKPPKVKPPKVGNPVGGGKKKKK